MSQPRLRAAIYARYSTHLQRDTSIEDQIRLCRSMIEARGWSVEGIYSDHAVSGQTQHTQHQPQS